MKKFKSVHGTKWVTNKEVVSIVEGQLMLLLGWLIYEQREEACGPGKWPQKVKLFEGRKLSKGILFQSQLQM